MCKPGYSISATTGNCVSSSLTGCKISIRLDGNDMCFLCDKTYPSADFQKCLPYPNSSGKFANCLAVALDVDKNPICGQCAAGYSSYGGYCVSTPVELMGCNGLTKDGLGCETCNLFDGWYNVTKDSSKCTKL